MIEHNLDVLAQADHIIDLGPEGGNRGGALVTTGTPEEVARHPGSYTGQYLKKVFARSIAGSARR
jgi:excinuclease ABC subunit A